MTSGIDINMDQRFPLLRRDDAATVVDADAPAAAASSDPVISAANAPTLLTESELRMADLRRRSESLGSQTERKRSRKKSNDKPKRPLSAYNIFFQLERQKLLEETDPPVDAANGGGKLSPTNTTTTKAKSKLGFASLARYIAAKWKNIDDESLAHYQDLADKEQRRYMNELVKWKIQEAHNLYDSDGPSTRPDAWVPQQPQQQQQQQQQQLQGNVQAMDEQLVMQQAQAAAANGWHMAASSSFLHDNGRFVSGGDSSSTNLSGHAAGSYDHFSDSVTSMGPLSLGYNGYSLSQLRPPAGYEHFANTPASTTTSTSNDEWLSQSADGINTRWSRHLENEMEATVKELSKMVPNNNNNNNGSINGGPFYVQELEPFPVSYMGAAASAAPSLLVQHSVEPVVAVHPPPSSSPAPESMPAAPSVDNHSNNDGGKESPSVQRLSLHLDEEEQEFLIARLAADAACNLRPRQFHPQQQQQQHPDGC